jgi:hypothetical protein
MRLSRYNLTKSTTLTVENVDCHSCPSFTFDAPKGTSFLGKWLPSKATKDMGDLVMAGGFVIPLCHKSLFEKA